MIAATADWVGVYANIPQLDSETTSASNSDTDSDTNPGSDLDLNLNLASTTSNATPGTHEIEHGDTFDIDFPPISGAFEPIGTPRPYALDGVGESTMVCSIPIFILIMTSHNLSRHLLRHLQPPVALVCILCVLLVSNLNNFRLWQHHIYWGTVVPAPFVTFNQFIIRNFCSKHQSEVTPQFSRLLNWWVIFRRYILQMSDVHHHRGNLWPRQRFSQGCKWRLGSFQEPPTIRDSMFFIPTWRDVRRKYQHFTTIVGREPGRSSRSSSTAKPQVPIQPHRHNTVWGYPMEVVWG